MFLWFCEWQAGQDLSACDKQWALTLKIVGKSVGKLKTQLCSNLRDYKFPFFILMILSKFSRFFFSPEGVFKFQ